MSSAPKNDAEDPISHWIVLVTGIVLAAALWLGWLFFGAGWAHSVASQHSTVLREESGQKEGKPVSNQAAVSAPAQLQERAQTFAELGQTGDSFGSLNALLTSIAGVFVGWAGFMQHQALRQARREAAEERAHRKRQEFEALFFQLLQLSLEATSRFEVASGGTTSEKRIGPRALDSYAWRIFDAVGGSSPGVDRSEILARLVRKFLVDVYDRKPSAFGPYFRLLYQTFKHVAESELPEHEQIRYANIARGQISEGAVLLLALNGLTYEGHKFAPLIEKFGLLEHLHRRYRAEYKDVLRQGYRLRAFLGSTERALPQHWWDHRPLLAADHFKSIDEHRSAADEEDDFLYGAERTEPE